jgi:hypothetical protein
LSVGKIETDVGREVAVLARGCLQFAGFRFRPTVIVAAVRWYLRFNVS